jgi:hypothetical protein
LTTPMIFSWQFITFWTVMTDRYSSVFWKNEWGGLDNLLASKENMLSDLNNAYGFIHFGSVDLEMLMGCGYPRCGQNRIASICSRWQSKCDLANHLNAKIYLGYHGWYDFEPLKQLIGWKTVSPAMGNCLRSETRFFRRASNRAAREWSYPQNSSNSHEDL